MRVSPAPRTAAPGTARPRQSPDRARDTQRGGKGKQDPRGAQVGRSVRPCPPRPTFCTPELSSIPRRARRSPGARRPHRRLSLASAAVPIRLQPIRRRRQTFLSNGVRRGGACWLTRARVRGRAFPRSEARVRPQPLRLKKKREGKEKTPKIAGLRAPAPKRRCHGGEGMGPGAWGCPGGVEGAGSSQAKSPF